MAGQFRNLYYNLNRWVFRWLPDSLYHNLLGWIMAKRFRVGYHWMNLNDPQTFSEKLQWLKSHGNIPLKTRLADKYDVREWVESKIGKEHLVPLLPLNRRGELVVDRPEDIDFECLPKNFVLKLTKGSGYNILCRGGIIDKESIIKKLRGWIKVDNYKLSREPHYKGKNRIIGEVMLAYNIEDYKFFCFNGQPKFLKVDVGRFTEHRANYYNLDWALMELNEYGCPRNPDILQPRPEQFGEMLSIAEKLCEGFPFVRVDLYVHDKKVYFGEMTFIPAGGYVPLSPREIEYQLGQLIDLTEEGQEC